MQPCSLGKCYPSWPEGSAVAGEGGGEEKASSQVYLSPIEYAYFEGVAVDEAAYASHNSTGLPPFPVMASRPTAANPLLFIHVPKTAGTVVRRALASVVVPTPVPGADGREKRVRDPGICGLPNYRCYRTGNVPLHTMAGHLQYMRAREVALLRNKLPPDTKVPCITFIRDPVDRLVSLYYYLLRDGIPQPLWRVGPKIALQAAAPDVALRALLGLLPDETRHMFGVENSHVPLLKLFGSIRIDDTLQPLYVSQADIDNATAVAKNLAVRNLRRCVVANTDDMPASMELINHFFPWLALAIDAVNRNASTAGGVKVNGREGVTHRHIMMPDGSIASEEVIVSPLPQATRDLFAGAIKEEVEVYQAALQLHRAQLAYARAATVVRGDVV